MIIQVSSSLSEPTVIEAGITALYASEASRAITASYAESSSYAHTSPPKENFIIIFDSHPAIAIIKNQPVEIYEPVFESRKQLNLINYKQARICVQVIAPGSVTSVIGAQYSINGGETWLFLDGINGPAAALIVTGSSVSPYVDLDETAKSDILIRWVTLNGNGITTPIIGSIILGLK